MSYRLSFILSLSLRRVTIVILLSISLNNCIAQICPFKKDTLFYIQIFSAPQKGWPRSGAGLIKNLNELKINTSSYEMFANDLYSSVIYTSDPYLGFQKMIYCFQDTSKKSIDSLCGNYLKTQRKMIKKITTFKNIFLKDTTPVVFEAVKVIGEFWKTDTDFETINGITHQIIVNPQYYTKPFFYRFKSIDCSEKLTKEEIKIIQSKIKEQPNK